MSGELAGLSERVRERLHKLGVLSCTRVAGGRLKLSDYGSRLLEDVRK